MPRTSFNLDPTRFAPVQRASYEAALGKPMVKQEAVVARLGSPLAAKFEQMYATFDPAPAYVKEAQVHPDRRFRWDYLFVEAKVAVELQGGIYLAGKGGHVSPKGVKNDCDKLNLGNLAGVVTFKLATGQITPDNVLMIRDFVLTRML